MNTIFKNKTYIFAALGVSFLLFDLMVYILANSIGEVNFTCSPGAYFTLGNVLYAGVFSLLFGFFVVGFYELVRLKSGGASILSLSGIGILLAALTTFCTLCTIPVISLFGFSVGLTIFTTFNEYFKIIALITMTLAILLLHKKLKKQCGCK